MSSDDSMSQGTAGFRVAGTGLAMTRNCLVGNHNVMHTAGSAWIRYRGIRTWCCAECTAKRNGAQHATKETS